MTTLRVAVKAPTAEAAEAVKEKFFKKLYEHNGTTVVFEVPVGADFSDIQAFAEESGCTVSSEEYHDPLDDAAAVDFW